MSSSWISLNRLVALSAKLTISPAVVAGLEGRLDCVQRSKGGRKDIPSTISGAIVFVRKVMQCSWMMGKFVIRS